jgi:hypothetical protein
MIPMLERFLETTMDVDKVEIIVSVEPRRLDELLEDETNEDVLSATKNRNATRRRKRVAAL